MPAHSLCPSKRQSNDIGTTYAIAFWRNQWSTSTR